MHDDGQIRSHPVKDGAAVLEGEERLVVGVGGTDNGRLEETLPVGLRELLLASDLVATVLPVGIVEGRGLGDGEVAHRFVICGSAADEDELFGQSPEEIDVSIDVLGRERHEVHHRIVFLSAQRRLCFGQISNIRANDVCLCGWGAFCAGGAAHEEIELVAALHGEL